MITILIGGLLLSIFPILTTLIMGHPIIIHNIVLDLTINPIILIIVGGYSIKVIKNTFSGIKGVKILILYYMLIFFFLGIVFDTILNSILIHLKVLKILHTFILGMVMLYTLYFLFQVMFSRAIAKYYLDK